ncbi:hypothetical protein ABFV05_020498 [Capra hircus]
MRRPGACRPAMRYNWAHSHQLWETLREAMRPQLHAYGQICSTPLSPQLQTVQKVAAQTLPPPNLALSACPSWAQEHHVLIPHPPGAAQLLQQVRDGVSTHPSLTSGFMVLPHTAWTRGNFPEGGAVFARCQGDEGHMTSSPPIRSEDSRGSAHRPRSLHSELD